MLDRSGSMSGENIDMLKAAMEKFIHKLRPQDKVSLVFFNSESALASKQELVNKPNLLNLVAALTASGGTNIYDGLKMGYEQVSSTFEANSTNRVILLTDGYGSKPIDFILEQSEKYFKKGISVGKPSGVVSLPEMNVLYKGYTNKVEGAASGFQTYSLSGSGCTVKKTGDGWVATVSKTSKAREASISITGKNADGASANLGKFPFRVQPMPKPNIYLGNLENGGSYAKSTVASQAALFARYGAGIPLDASFSVIRWNISSSTGEREISGKGKILSGAAKGVLKQARKGSVISIFVEGSGPGGKFRQSSSIKVK